jgi:peptide/nickel transport system ATP-binding protein
MLAADFSVSYGKKVAVDHVALEVSSGESLAIVGASGSGKSTVALALAGLVGWRGGRITGSVRFRDCNLVTAKERELRHLRGREVALVLQSASSALNPALRLETQFREAWEAHAKSSWALQRKETLERFARFRLPDTDEFLRRYPGEISIGQAQRVLIALALLHRPALLIADEPTSALDPITARDVLESLRLCNRDWNTALVYITHDVLTVPGLCQRVMIMKEGCVIEQGDCGNVFADPQHEYTRDLLCAARANTENEAMLLHLTG